jgi:single-stranded-DNA-specific exonuclease
MNEWNGRRTPQLIVRDLAVPHLQVFDWRSNRFIMTAGRSKSGRTLSVSVHRLRRVLACCPVRLGAPFFGKK